MIISKLVILGDSSVGKSSIARRFAKGNFYEYNEPTIGAAFLTKTVNVTHDATSSHDATLSTFDKLESSKQPVKTVNFEIWDTAGQERYRSLAPMYYKNASTAIVVYDVTNIKSFESAKHWVNELKMYTSSNVSDIVIVLVGNKTDCKDRKIYFEMGQQYAKQNNMLFMETSAKQNKNITDVFTMLAKELKEEIISDDTIDTNTIELNTSAPLPVRRCCI